MRSVISFIGRSGVGKTTLIENIIPELKARGYRVAVIKHTPHGFDMDTKGKDSWRFSSAGADIVAVSSLDRLCVIQQTPEETSLEQIISTLESQVDLILVEGYKHSHWPKIEVMRSPLSYNILNSQHNIEAVVSDQQLPLDIPQFRFHETRAIASFIIERLTVETLAPMMDEVAYSSPGASN
mgnify:FL=1